MKKRLIISITITLFALGLSRLATEAQQQFQYPKTRKVDHVDTYHGTKVPDPYRWLEDDNSAETKQWVDEQNKITFDYLGKIPFRAKIKDRLTQLQNYPKYTAPSRRGEYFIFSKNDGLQNQSVLYIQKGWKGPRKS